jgi:glycosyltransferase involved in cell wall biosynthesis
MKVRDVDVVVGTLPPFFQPWSAWLVALLRRKPFLLEVRDLWVETAIELGALKNPSAIAVAHWMERRLYSRARHIVVNSPGFIDYLVRTGVARDKISLVPNGVDTQMFRPEATGDAVRREFGLQDKFVVTYAGALGLVNGLDPVLRVAERLRHIPEVHFLLVGDGRRREHLQKEAARLQLSNVTFTGPQPKQRMPEVLAASDACLAILRDTPVLRTTYPNKVFDYMAAGRPTILAIDGVIREVVEAAQAGIYVSPADDAEVASAVEMLLGDRERARKMGAAGRTYVVQHFERGRQAEQFEAVLRMLAAAGRSSSAKSAASAGPSRS